MSSQKGDKVPYARLCHIVKWEDFDGYGFNLHAEKRKNGQFIGKVDEGSPSQAAGLRQGDRIVEVNEINIANETHKQVVERIKAFANETKLLVVDQEADDYFRANNIVIKGTMANVKVIKSPERNPNTVQREDPSYESGASVEEQKSEESREGESKEKGSVNAAGSSGEAIGTMRTSPSGENVHDREAENEKEQEQEEGAATTTTTTTTTTAAATVARENGSRNELGSHVHGTGNGSVPANEPPRQGLNLKMSAKELRAQLAARKKYDPKKESIGFKDKFDIVQKL